MKTNEETTSSMWRSMWQKTTVWKVAFAIDMSAPFATLDVGVKRKTGAFLC
jgi:hypothetical protein